MFFFFFSSRRRHTRSLRDWSSDVCSSDLAMPEFSLDLTEDQRDLRDWVHGFAAEVVRPAAAEWDAREETPWPLIQQAAKVGLYGFEFLATAWADPTGLSLP